ncbi:MAG: hypothetical protein ACK5LK_06085 [Chthoniobacterales bacterium]
MEKHYSSGRKGRLERHADLCKKNIYEACPTPDLAIEFIEITDPESNNAVWQRFKEPADVFPEVTKWLNPPDLSTTSDKGLKTSGDKLATAANLHLVSTKPLEGRIVIALKRTKAWLATDTTRKKFQTLQPAEAAQLTLEQVARELRDDASDKKS